VAPILPAAPVISTRMAARSAVRCKLPSRDGMCGVLCNRWFYVSTNTTSQSAIAMRRRKPHFAYVENGRIRRFPPASLARRRRQRASETSARQKCRPAAAVTRPSPAARAEPRRRR
jgi:hypothetical protein